MAAAGRLTGSRRPLKQGREELCEEAGSSPDSLTLPSMNRNFQPDRLNLLALASDGQPWTETTLVKDLQRLAEESHGLNTEEAVRWQARGELRPKTGADDEVWLHLSAQVSWPLTCQRCLTPVITNLNVDQWYRFVATEEIAMAEDDEAEEDLLVMAPQFDLLALLEDELLMAVPLVPMHETCPETLKFSSNDPAIDAADVPETRLNPFAVLQQLKKS
jgi:uncharacterized protein